MRKKNIVLLKINGGAYNDTIVSVGKYLFDNQLSVDNMVSIMYLQIEDIITIGNHRIERVI
jgi:hypothetical protein